MSRFGFVFSFILSVLLCFDLNEVLAQTATSCPSARKHGIRPKIVGGQKAKLQHWPGQVAIRVRNPNRRESVYVCGGSLIADSWVLTAAHCFQKEINGKTVPFFQQDSNGNYYTSMEEWGFDNPSLKFRGKAYLEIVFGVDDLRSVKPTNVRPIQQIITHPQYREASVSGNDIALLQLKTSAQVDLARISTQSIHDPQTPPGAITLAAGFGDQQWKAPLERFVTVTGSLFAAGSEVLREVDLPTISNSTCRDRFPGAAIGPGQICVGYEEGRKDSCQGDSGGPLVTLDQNRCPYQIGIVSWGPKCAVKQAYGVYTRISSFFPWIRKYVPEVKSVASADIPKMDTASRLFAANQALTQLSALLSDTAGTITLQLRPLQKKTQLSDLKIRLGERYLFEVSSSIGGRLILVDINSVGEITQIFPNQYVASSQIGRIIPNQLVQIPGKDYKFQWFKAVAPVGNGRLLALVVPEDFVSLYDSLPKQWSDKGFIPEQAPSNFLANLVDQIYGFTQEHRSKPKKYQDWAFDIFTYEIVLK